MRRITSFALSVFGLLAVLPVSSAHADQYGDYWGGIGFIGRRYQTFSGYSDETAVIFAMQRALGSNTHHVQFSSGRCGALIGYKDDLGRSGYQADTGNTRDGAMRNALSDVYHTSYHLVVVKCQD